MRGFGEVVVDFLLLRLFAVVTEEHHVVVDSRLEVDGAGPDVLDAFEGFDGVFDFDVQAIVLVSQV